MFYTSETAVNDVSRVKVQAWYKDVWCDVMVSKQAQGGGTKLLPLSPVSKEWRIVADEAANPTTWDVYMLEFYSSLDCTGNKLNVGNPIYSGHYPLSRFKPLSAFDDSHPSLWEGRQNVDRLLWLGIQF